MKRPEIKICGMTRKQDVALCSSMGADYLGFIFHEPSPRNVSPDFAASVNTGHAAKVGVFVNQSVAEIEAIMHQCGLDFAQLHGGQNKEFCMAVRPERVIKALWPEKYDSPEALQADIDRFSPHCAALLFDAGTSGGGHGRLIDLVKLQDIEINKKWFLAGGLGPDNVTAVLESDPHVLDINSGVESAPGIKNEQKLRAVMQRLSEAS